MKKRLDMYDGLRLYAIYLIMASHSGAFHLTVGGTMVALFFTLSGFFAARPQSDKLVDFRKPEQWITFYIKRAARILPVFWLVSFFMLLTGTFKGGQGLGVFLKNISLLEADGHFWYVQNQAVIYLLEPFILLAIFLINENVKMRKPNLVFGCALIAAGIALGKILPKIPALMVMGNGKKQTLRIGIFCIGMGAGFIAKELKEVRIKSRQMSIAADVVEFGLLIMGAFTAGYYLVKFGLTDREVQVGWQYPEICAILAGVLILLLYVNSEGTVAKILSLRFFREIGAASYCVFLVQSVFVRTIHVASREKLWIIVCLASSGIGYMSYHLFETPLNQAVSRWLKKHF